MNTQPNINIGSWLAQLNGKTVDKIYQVDYTIDRYEDCYAPFLFYFTFFDLDIFLEIEGDFDGDHIRIKFYGIQDLSEKLKENDHPEEHETWKVYNTEPNEMLGKLIGRKVEFVEYGIDKDEYVINGQVCKGEKNVFNFIRFNTGNLSLTIFEATGLGVSDEPNMEFYFEGVYDRYDTR
jgi:hypothetical protein